MRAIRTAALLLLATLVSGQSEVFVPANDVSFTVAPEHLSYRTGEEVVVKYQITNISNGSVYAPREWENKCPPNPHIWAWFENSSGRHFIPGYAGDCSPSQQTVLQRMQGEAVLLKPGQQLRGHISLDTTLFGGLPPGAYRVEAVLYGWNDKEFDEHQRNELQKLSAPFITGEVPASTSIILRSRGQKR
jgi:hypothetical protein